jgi:hypothetical protein
MSIMTQIMPVVRDMYGDIINEGDYVQYVDGLTVIPEMYQVVRIGATGRFQVIRHETAEMYIIDPEIDDVRVYI